MEKRIDREFEGMLAPGQTGMAIWRNKKNQFVVVELHYTADPEKRGAEWKERTSAGMPRDEWEREYELSWETYEGTPVHGDYADKLHVWDRDQVPEIGLPIFRGWDSSGLSPAVVFFQLSGRRVTVLEEMAERACPAATFVPAVVEWSRRIFGSYSFIDICDPAGAIRSSSNMQSYFSIMVDNKLAPIEGALTLEARIGAVNRLLCTLWRGHPLIMLNPRCKLLRQALAGGYHIGKDGKPVKNEFSHIAEALQYGVSKVDWRLSYQSGGGTSSNVIPMPAYGKKR